MTIRSRNLDVHAFSVYNLSSASKATTHSKLLECKVYIQRFLEDC